MKINNIALAIAGLLVLGLASCQKNAHEYEPAAPETGSQVYFPTGLPTSYNLKEVINENGNILFIPVQRLDSTAAVTVDLSSSIEALYEGQLDAFTFPEEVSFEAGEGRTEIGILFEDDKIIENLEYTIELTLENETSAYGASSYTFTASIPAAWTYWGEGHVTEVCWAEDYDTELWYMETDYDNILYCKLVDAWNDISGDEPVPTADYYFYWDTETNNLFVPMQSIGMVSSSGYDIYTSDASSFYNAYQSWGYVIPSDEYFEWAPKWLAKNSFFQPYYDGNGGFYLADWMYLCQGGVPTGSGYQFGGDPDYFIAEGFTRTVDYNDDDHLGASEPLVTGNVKSMFFSNDGETPVEFVSGLRCDEYEEGTEEVVYYLPNYFGAGEEGKCLAFMGPVPEAAEIGSVITDVANEQATGISFMGSDIYVKVKTGLFNISIVETDTFPAFNLTLKVFAKDEEGNVTFDFGEVEESFAGYEALKDHYTLDDLYGGYYDDYLGTWNMTGTFESQSGLAEKSYDVEFLEGVKDSSFKIVNLSSYKSAFADTVIAYYNSSYGILEVHPQTLNAKYSGYDVSLGLLDFDSGYWYDSEQVTIYGGICTDGNFAFVNAYTGYNICGFYYYVTVSSQVSGLLGVYYVNGSYAGPSPAPKYAAPRKDYVTAIPAVKSALRGGMNIGKTVLSRNSANCVEKAAINRATFNLQPIEKSDNRKEIELPSINVIR